MPHPKNAALDVPAKNVSVLTPGGLRDLDAPRVRVQAAANGAAARAEPDAYALGRRAGELWAVTLADFAHLDALALDAEAFLLGFGDGAQEIGEACQEPLDVELPQEAAV